MGAAIGDTLDAASVYNSVAQMGLSIAQTVDQGRSNDIAVAQANLPSCEQAFVGTITVQAGGTNVTGDSIFQSNLAVAGDLTLGGRAGFNQLEVAQGASFVGGGIVIGDPGGTTYSSGITVGGGAVSGAGVGGPQAATGDATAIAIGNGAQATMAG